MEKKTYCFDIDGTICKTVNGDYKNSKPIKSRISKVNKLNREGHTIIYFTSRGFVTGIDWSELTKKQFKKWRVRFHQVIFGKPYANIYVDDHGFNDKKFFKR